MEADRLKWNTKHLERPMPDTPSELLVRFLPQAVRGRALDVACGLGRNSRYLAEQGFTVEGVDLSDVAVERLRDDARIEIRQEDMDHYQIPAGRYALIGNFYFLKRRLFPYMKEGLQRGGMLLFESYVEDERFCLESFQNRDHYLRPNELLHAFLGLHILYYHEHPFTRPDGQQALLASLVALKP